ncbi:Cationic amino acid transporter 8, vacuolar [Acorus calamus]|uniref:Cationic amino acid transporter 8, vacuolar n=1 Tax=Acorus calamus TaxID=4465 RepID=A0AAV9F4N4_ACOCL|nr:Cationic amino acid transporter 8, vacuolar [Acorus calamus]
MKTFQIPKAKSQHEPAVVISYAIALISVLYYASFAVNILVAGGSFFYLCVKLNNFIAFIIAANILLESLHSTTRLVCS